MSFDPVALLSNQPNPPTDTDETSPSLVKRIPPIYENFRQKTWSQAAGAREVSAPLASLPAEIKFTEEFPEPITYDGTRRLLVYRGFMTNTSYVELQKLSRNLDYTRSLEQLFTASAIDPAEAKRASGGLVIGIVVIAIVAVAALVWRMMG